MALQQREYLLTTNKYKEPSVVEGKQAIGMLLLRLIIMNPGTDPLHPDMGVGIINYRYTMDIMSELKKKITKQIQTYLPQFSDSIVSLVWAPDHTLNVEITTNDVTYVYESGNSPNPITLSDISEN